MAAEGITFMQSMIELAKFRNNDAGTLYHSKLEFVFSKLEFVFSKLEFVFSKLEFVF